MLNLVVKWQKCAKIGIISQGGWYGILWNMAEIEQIIVLNLWLNRLKSGLFPMCPYGILWHHAKIQVSGLFH